MPTRRSRVDALDVIAYTDGIATLDLHVSSGTYVRSIADALGGHCTALRRTEVGPFPSRGRRRGRAGLDEALGRIGLTLAEAEADRDRRATRDRGDAAASTRERPSRGSRTLRRNSSGSRGPSRSGRSTGSTEVTRA